MKLILYKFLLSSLLFFACGQSYATPIYELIRTWKEKNEFLIFIVPVQFDVVDPILSINAHTKLSLPLIFEPIVTIDAQQELQPVLAQSWAISSDKKYITIKIKSNHYFSDGKEVTSKDVAASLKRVCSPDSKVAEELKGLKGCIKNGKGHKEKLGIEIIGKYEIKLDINCNPTTFLYQLTSPSTVVTKTTNTGIIGSGPYFLQENKKDYLIVRQNPFSSYKDKIANKGIVFFYANPKKIDVALKKDKIDGALMYVMENIANFKDSNYNLYKINPNITAVLVLNNQRFPFNQPIVRQALSATIYNNFEQNCVLGSHKAYGIIPYGTGGSIDNTPPKVMNEILPEEVFLKVPGLRNKKISVTIHQLEDLKRTCESNQIIEAAKKYNIDLKFKYHHSYSSLEPLYINHNLDGFIELYVFRNREAYSILQFFTTTGENNANINDNNIDLILKNAISSPSTHGRFQAYRHLTQYIQDQGIVVPLFYIDHGNLLSKCISGTSENFFFNPFIHLPQLYRIKNCSF